jgi:hypothetical protein
MKEEKDSLLGPVGQEWFNTRPVGGRIPKKRFDEWEKFKNRCFVAGLKMSPDGILDMLETYNRINDVLYPMASAYDFKPVQFKNDVLDIILGALKEISKDKWKEDSTKIKTKIHDKLNEIVKVSIE